jgi:phosphoglycerate kinase
MFTIAEASALNRGAISIVGGGDSIKAVNESDHGQDVIVISTGGASSEFPEIKVFSAIDVFGKSEPAHKRDARHPPVHLCFAVLL